MYLESIKYSIINFKTLVIVFFQFIIVFTGFSQYVIRNLDLDDGLIDIQCFDVSQDSDGYLWIGTRSGVNKYDGRDMQSFDRSDGLLADNIFSIHEDSQKRKWLINLNGEPMYIKDDIVHNRITDPHLSKLKSDKYKQQIFENSNGDIVFVEHGCTLKVLLYDTIMHYDFSHLLNGENGLLYAAFEVEDGYLAFFSFGIAKLNSDFIFKEMIVKFDQAHQFFRKCRYKNKIIFASNYAIHSLDIGSREVKDIFTFDDLFDVNDIRVAGDSLYISTSIGLKTIIDDLLVNIYKEVREPITGVVQMEEGNIWLSCLNCGILSISNSKVKKSRFASLGPVSMVEQHDKDIYVGTKSGEVILYADNEDAMSYLDNYIGEPILKSLKINDRLWIKSKLALIDPNDRYFGLYTRDVEYSQKMERLYFTSDKGVFSITHDSLIEIDENIDNLMLDHFDAFTFYPIAQAYQLVNFIDDDILVGNEDGLYLINEFGYEKIDFEELSGSIIQLKANDSVVFGINYGKGIFSYDIKTQEISFISNNDGLLSNNMTKLALGYPFVYASHAKGISILKYAGSKLQFVRNISAVHGMPEGDIDFLSVVNNVPHFGIDNQLYELDLKGDIDILSVDTEINATSFYTNDIVTISFNCMDYTYGKELYYEYKLVPSDSTWTKTTDEQLDYRFLPDGEYEFQVRAKHPIHMTTKVSSIPFVVSNHWYQSNLFYSITAFFALLATWFLFYIKALRFNIDTLKSYFIQLLTPPKQLRITVKDVNGHTHIINIENLLYVKASGNYVEYHASNKKIISRSTLKQAKLLFTKSSEVTQIHRSYLANLDRISSVSAKLVTIDGVEVPFSDSYKSVVESAFSKA